MSWIGNYYARRALVTHNLIIHEELRAQIVVRNLVTFNPTLEIHLWVNGNEYVVGGEDLFEEDEIRSVAIQIAKNWAEGEIVLRTKQKELPLLIGSLESKHSLELLTGRLQGKHFPHKSHKIESLNVGRKNVES